MGPLLEASVAFRADTPIAAPLYAQLRAKHA
jgi:hypothetical protein